MVTQILPTVFRIISMASVFSLVSCIPLGTTNPSSTSKNILFDDQNYEDYVGNVIINSNNPFQAIGIERPLNMEFDLFSNEFENLQVHYIHCNSDWTKSKLQEIEYLKSFNQLITRVSIIQRTQKLNTFSIFLKLTGPFWVGIIWSLHIEEIMLMMLFLLGEWFFIKIVWM